jgi:hypothetical protein
MVKRTHGTKLAFLGLLAVLLLLPTVVHAALILPGGSFWQGGRNYDKDGVQAFVEYAVYDTTSTAYLNVSNKITNPGTGQYIYAYQVFDNISAGLQPITAFELLGGNPALASGIGSKRDGTGQDIVPTNDGTSFVWKFENGVFVFDKHSAFMVFSTDTGPVAGTFNLSTQSDYGEEPPTPDVPEPATVALLATGAMGIIGLRRKK